MNKPSDPSRIAGTVQSLDYESTSKFFEERGRSSNGNPLTATMYQAAELAERRDREEKERILPLLRLHSEDRVLDFGCGTGRWAQAIIPAVNAYLGIDFSESLLETARKRFPDGVFQTMNVARLSSADLAIEPPFDVIICSGILAYINDDDLVSLAATFSEIAAPHSRIYIREPMAKASRLTLDRHWSEELKTHYSAIYRTKAEYLSLFESIPGLHLSTEGEPFSSELQNRDETEQRYLVLEYHRAQ